VSTQQSARYCYRTILRVDSTRLRVNSIRMCVKSTRIFLCSITRMRVKPTRNRNPIVLRAEFLLCGQHLNGKHNQDDLKEFCSCKTVKKRKCQKKRQLSIPSKIMLKAILDYLCSLRSKNFTRTTLLSSWLCLPFRCSPQSKNLRVDSTRSTVGFVCRSACRFHVWLKKKRVDKQQQHIKTALQNISRVGHLNTLQIILKQPQELNTPKKAFDSFNQSTSEKQRL
jgi:hypothetical protein